MIKIKFYLTSILIGMVFTQCVLFEPKINTVPDEYVQEKTMSTSDKEAIDKLNLKVISLNNDITKQKKLNTINEQSLQISNSKIQKQKFHSDVLRDKEKLALIKEDTKAVKRFQKEFQLSEKERTDEESRQKAWEHKGKADEAYYAYLESELTESISNLEMRRARIAVNFQNSEGKSPKDTDYIVIEEFIKQHSKTVEDSRKKKLNWDNIKLESINLSKVKLEDTYLDGKK
jgi:hypothetical protein